MAAPVSSRALGSGETPETEMTQARGSHRGNGLRTSRFLAFLFGADKSGMSYIRAGRILAGIVLIGLVAVPFAGQISLAFAAIVVGSLQLVWLLIDGAKEVRSPLRRRSWGIVVTIVVEYSVFMLVVVVALVFFIRALPGFVDGR